jgi:hypothetical protein
MQVIAGRSFSYLRPNTLGFILANVVKKGPATAGDVREGPVRSLHNGPTGLFYGFQLSAVSFQLS